MSDQTEKPTVNLGSFANTRLEPAHVDHLLAAPDLGAGQIRALLGSGAPNIDLLLYIAEHPLLARLERDNRLPEELETLLVQAFFSAMPHLGIRAYGPLISLRVRARARLDAERRKYQLLAEYVERASAKPAAALRLLRNYLETDPAPIFISAVRTRWPAWLSQAEDARARGEGLDILLSSAALIDALGAPQGAAPARVAEELARLMAALLEVVGQPEAADLLLRRALKSGAPQAKLVAAALATFGGRTDLVQDILGVFLSGAPQAPQFAVMAARLAPLMARNTFAQYLVDIAGQNPEEPEAKITAARTHTILSARSVLPLIGSPLAEMSAEELPDTEEFAQLRQIPATVAATWKMWQAVAGAASPESLH